MAKVTAVTTAVPFAGLPQIPTQSNSSDKELTQTMFPSENARLLSKSAVFALCSPGGGWYPGWSQEGQRAIGALCRNAPMECILMVAPPPPFCIVTPSYDFEIQQRRACRRLPPPQRLSHSRCFRVSRCMVACFS